MTLLAKILFLFAALYAGSLKASTLDETARFLASLKPGSNFAQIQRMLTLIQDSNELDEMAFDGNKRSLIHYVEEHQKFQSERIAALNLPEDAYDRQITESREIIVLQGIDNVDQSISSLEGIIRLQKGVILRFYDQLRDASTDFYRNARGTGSELAPSKIFLQLIKDEGVDTTKGREIFVARLMLGELNAVALRESQPKPARRKESGASFSLAIATQLKQGLWDLAESIATTRNGLLADMAQTMKEFAVDVACLRAGVEFFNENSAIKGKQIRTGVIRELNRLSTDEVDGRIALVRESLDLASRMSDTPRIKKAVTVLSSLINVKALKAEDRLQQANLFLQIAKLSEQYSSEEPFETAINYCNAFMIYPDAAVRQAISADLFRLLPASYDAYQRWKEKLALQSTRAVLESLEKLRWFHIKLLLLEGNSADSLRLLKPRKPKPVRIEAKPVLSLETTPVVEQASYSPPRREPETSDDEPEWDRYRAVNDSQEEFRQLRRETQERAKALAEKEARKQILKEAKERRLAEGAVEESQPDDDDVIASYQVLPLATNAHRIFEKFFLLKETGGPRVLGLDVPLSDYDGLTFEDNVNITPDDFEILVNALNGKAQSGKGRHKKAKISPLSFQLNGKQVDLIGLEEELSAAASQTVTYTQTPYLPFYQIEQIREKLLALGYSPHTVSSVREAATAH